MTAKEARKLTGACNRFQAASAIYDQLGTRSPCNTFPLEMPGRSTQH